MTASIVIAFAALSSIAFVARQMHAPPEPELKLVQQQSAAVWPVGARRLPQYYPRHKEIPYDARDPAWTSPQK